MDHHIRRDHGRFKDIVKENIKKDIGKYISKKNIIYRKGEKLVRIPITSIDLPRFKYGGKQGGVGQGPGEIGDVLGHDPVYGNGKDAGLDPNELQEFHMEFSLEELAKMLGEALELPNIQDRGKKGIYTEKESKTTIIRTGPESLRDFKRTYKEALKRYLISGEYDPEKPIIIPERPDRRYRYHKKRLAPTAQAVIMYMLDVSGSMIGDPYEIFQLESLWIETWLRSQYKVLDFVYILHDARAERVSSKDFRQMFAGGGTLFNPAYKLCLDTIQKEYPAKQWNIYPFHFTDGDNAGTVWKREGKNDDDLAFEFMQKIVEASNQFSYCQINGSIGEGRFAKLIKARFGKNDKIVVSELSSRKDIAKSIKEIFGKGN